MSNFSTPGEKAFRKLESAKERSLRAILFTIGLLLFLIAAVLMAERFFRVPFWLEAIFIGIPAFTLIGDTINVVTCTKRLRAK